MHDTDFQFLHQSHLPKNEPIQKAEDAIISLFIHKFFKISHEMKDKQ